MMADTFPKMLAYIRAGGQRRGGCKTRVKVWKYVKGGAGQKGENNINVRREKVLL